MFALFFIVKNYARDTWIYHVTNDVWTKGVSMQRGREYHACGVRGKDVFVIGGEQGKIANSIEIWNGAKWKYSISQIGGTYLKILSQGSNIYLFGGLLENGTLSAQIWKIDRDNTFSKAGRMSMPRRDYALFSVPRSFLTNCKGI